MAFIKPNIRLNRKSFLNKTKENINRRLKYQDSDEIGHRVIEDPGYSPIWSTPLPRQRIPGDDHSPEFLEIDIPDCSMICSPKASRGFNSRLRKFSPINYSLEIYNVQQVPRSEVNRPDSELSPPHRKLTALRLFDTPHTPKVLLENSRRQRPTFGKPRISVDRPLANVNPFTPDSQHDHNDSGYCASAKRSRSELERSLVDDSLEELAIDSPALKKLALHEINTSRYNEEFHEVCKLGDGAFGSVFQCVHRLDGCTYAIKKSKTPVAGSAFERTAMNEVYAHAVLGKHQHVVRYYSAWAEKDHMYIQNEYCNGGSLAEFVDQHKQTGGHFTEQELVKILYHVAQGLRYIHSQNLVHLDIKPGNIFINHNPRLMQSSWSGCLESSFDEDDEFEEDVIYKIGDLGHVTSVINPCVEDGDCRYLAREILAENFDYLPKADIFSLGLTMFELGGGGELPKNGDKWHAIRLGELPELPHYSQQLNSLLKSMIHESPSDRPTALAITQNAAVLCPQGKKSHAELRRELNEERLKNQLLSQKLTEATKWLTQEVNKASFLVKAQGINNTTFQVNDATFGVNNVSFLVPPPVKRNSRLIGSKMKRSRSLTAF